MLKRIIIKYIIRDFDGIQLYTIECPETGLLMDIEADKFISDKLYEYVDACEYVDGVGIVAPDAKVITVGLDFRKPCNTLVSGWNDLETWCRKNNRLDILNAFIAGNNALKPSEVSHRRHRNYKWKCNNIIDKELICNYVWEAAPNNIVKTKSKYTMCPACRARLGKSKTLMTGINDLETYCLKNNLTALLQDYNLANNVKLPSEISAKSHERVNWCCHTCGHKWNTALSDRSYSGNGCPKCYDLKPKGPSVKTGVNDLMTWAKSNNREDIIECWSDRNTCSIDTVACKTDMYSVYLNCRICNREIETKPYLIVRSPQSTLCKHCKLSGTSVPQIVLHKILENRFNSDLEYRKKLPNRFELDEYIPSLNLGIEYNGGMHLTPAGIEKDKIKSNLCSNLGIKLLVIQESKTPNPPEICGNTLIICYKDNKSMTSFQVVLDLIESNTGVKLAPITDAEFNEVLQYATNNITRAEVLNNITVTHPEIATDWDYEKNGNLRPEQFTYGSHQKVYWICRYCATPHSFSMAIQKRCSGQDCPAKGNRRAITGVNDLATTNPNLLRFWDYYSNNKENTFPDKITSTTSRKAHWICPKCGTESYEHVSTFSKRGRCRACRETINH